MPDFPKLRLKQFPQIQDRETSEAKYWKSYSVTKEEKLLGTPNCIHFNPASPDSYLVTASTKVMLYDAHTDKVQRAFSRFTDDCYSGRFRKDGKLMVAGDKEGHVKVFDVKTKSMLRQLKRHTAAVRATTWAGDGLHMVSGGDDKRVKLWDLATQEVVWDSKDAHTDYVRCVEASPAAGEVFMSAGYDHAVRVWDRRQERPVCAMTHGHPVECCLAAPAGAMLLTAGGNEVKLWDVLSGGRLMHTYSNHQKNVTGLTFDGTGSRLLSCGLDGHVKVYSLQTMQVVHGMRFGAPLMALAVSSDNKKLLVGFVDGSLMVRTRRADALGSLGVGLGGPAAPSSSSSAAKQQSRFYKGAGAAAEQTEDGMVETERSVRLRPYEVQLKKFNYQQALDSALKTRNPLVVVTVLEELSRRSGLAIALAGRDEATLEPLLSFAARYVSHPRYARLIVLVAHKVLDLYGGVLGHSDAIDELFLKLHKQVKAEVGFQRQIMQVMGSLDAIVNSAMMPPAPARGVGRGGRGGGKGGGARGGDGGDADAIRMEHDDGDGDDDES
jgi:U3 small nucleolar RNA-associated protein 15